MAPSNAELIESELNSNTLEILEGHLKSVAASPSGAQVTLRTHDGSETFSVNRVINCTGPSMNYRRVDSPLLRKLFDNGLVTAGPLGAGFNSAENGAVIDADGRASEVVFNLGPGRLGNLLESIAVPEIREQAVALAETLKQSLRLKNLAEPDLVSAVARTSDDGVAA